MAWNVYNGCLVVNKLIKIQYETVIRGKQNRMLSFDIKKKNCLDSLPHMPVFSSSNSAANENMMSKMWKNGVQLSD